MIVFVIGATVFWALVWFLEMSLLWYKGDIRARLVRQVATCEGERYFPSYRTISGLALCQKRWTWAWV